MLLKVYSALGLLAATTGVTVNPSTVGSTTTRVATELDKPTSEEDESPHYSFLHMTDLHIVARDLQDLQRRRFYSLRCEVSSQRVSNSYRCFRFGEDYECKDLGDIIDDFAHWARILLRDEYEYLTSDEAVKEVIEANEYEFDEAGNLS